ncbi:hypothetical protein EEQ75_11575, partial [Staphylococcus pseudintermedius]|nr:hypothetical protein [Staphylococcus pseudintermedius]
MYMINPTLNIKLYQNYELEELLGNRLYELNDEAILRLLSALESRFTYEEAVNSITSIFDCEKEMSEDIFKTILERNIFIEGSKDDALYKNKLEWIERNWSPSLLHYVTSRNIEFQDTGSDED